MSSAVIPMVPTRHGKATMIRKDALAADVTTASAEKGAGDHPVEERAPAKRIVATNEVASVRLK